MALFNSAIMGLSQCLRLSLSSLTSSAIFLLLLMQALEVGYLHTMLVCSGPPRASPSLLLLFLSTVSVLEVLTVLGLWAFISAWQVQHVQPLRILPEFKLSHQLESHPSAIHQYGLALQWTEAAACMSDAWIWIFINRLGWLSVNRWHWTHITGQDCAHIEWHMEVAEQLLLN